MDCSLETMMTKRLLARIDAASLLESQPKDDPDVELPAKVLAEYSMTELRKLKILAQQLQVVKLLLDFVAEADSAPWAESSMLEATRKELNQVKAQWKELKEEYLEEVEKIEAAIPQLLGKLEQLKTKKSLLEEALHQYQQKAAAMEVLRQQQRVENTRLAGCVGESRQRIGLCEDMIQRIQTELQQHQLRGEMWMENVKRDSDLLQLLEGLSGIRLVSVSEQDIVLDVQDPCAVQQEPQLKPLRMTLRWTKDDKLQVQTDSTFITQADALLEEHVPEVKMAVLEMQNAYRSQARLLQELDGLHDKFPVDWRPKERKLLYLKGSVVCVLLIDPGYPTSGGIQLLSLQGYTGSVDIRLLKPPHASPTLCNWLVYLSSNSEI
ncbi:ZW10 interactor isoform X2 [Pleurodeles waltl]|uniref:ZW10 interactor isoform X2 n=1 Tax=Pleurodeles waltl TaxID=8319 RepID=UPI003709A3AD